MKSSSIPEKDALVIQQFETLLCPFIELLFNWKQEKVVISIERIFCLDMSEKPRFHGKFISLLRRNE
jgi:hypothetical protein